MANQAQKPDLQLSTLKELLAYNSFTGEFRWLKSVGGPYAKRIAAGSLAGTLNKERYRYIHLGKSSVKASRLAWLFMTGEWPADQVDHINHNPSDDRWDNLRLATGSQNKANCRTYKKKSCTLKGVQAVQKRHSVRYRAVVTKDGIKRNLGNFDTELEAHIAYVRAAEALHGEFACAGGRD